MMNDILKIEITLQQDFIFCQIQTSSKTDIQLNREKVNTLVSYDLGYFGEELLTRCTHFRSLRAEKRYM